MSKTSGMRLAMLCLEADDTNCLLHNMIIICLTMTLLHWCNFNSIAVSFSVSTLRCFTVSVSFIIADHQS